MSTTTNPEKLSLRTKLMYGVGDVGINLADTMVGLLFAIVLTLLASFLILTVALAAFGQKKPKDDPNVRMVQGSVFDAEGNGVEGAVVQLKNTKNLQIRSFISKEHGSFYFHNLDANIDYELKAEYQAQTSPVKTLSSFDNRRQPVINLRLEPRK